ncbi:MAG: hypothetical protein J3R72DRAFT_434837 [Linnemannia gamsii]|nr:MAG: hypothetical protein J3R72DRAFT_434837 [Linnemannia gamsii]
MWHGRKLSGMHYLFLLFVCLWPFGRGTKGCVGHKTTFTGTTFPTISTKKQREKAKGGPGTGETHEHGEERKGPSGPEEHDSICFSSLLCVRYNVECMSYHAFLSRLNASLLSEIERQKDRYLFE